MKIASNSKGIISFGGKSYALNLANLKKICLSSMSEEGAKEIEITNAYETSDTGELTLSTKVEHEVKSIGNPQNDMIIYDVVKIVILSLLEDNTTEVEQKLTFGTVLAINTLIHWGILEEL
jgi:hypothetical protein